MWLETMDSMQLTHASAQPDPMAESHDIRPGRLLIFPAIDNSGTA
jgi:hypothetical protein